MIQAVKAVQSKLWVDRLEATVEAHILPAARVREACTIPGVSVQTSFLCRDKPAMKQALREQNIPCAASLGSSDRDEIIRFAQHVGYPLILKPPAGAGAAATHRVDNDEQLAHAMNDLAIGRGGSAAVEERLDDARAP